MAQSFEYAANKLLESNPKETQDKYPEIIEWQIAAKNRRNE
jgi:hypothetical protein